MEKIIIISFQRFFGIILIFLIIIPNSLYSQKYNISHYSVEDGLLLSEISYIYQDKQGYMYFGTYGGGFSKYDGRQFQNYNSAQGLVNNVVNVIVENERGNLIIGTDKGLSIFNGKVFVNYGQKEGLKHLRVFSLLPDSNNTVWIGTEKGLFLLSGDKIKEVPLKLIGDKSVYSLVEQTHDNLLIGTNSGLYLLAKKELNISLFHEELNGIKINSLLTTSDGVLWVGTNLGAYSFRNDSFTLYDEFSGISNNTIWKIAEDKQKRIWFGTEKGLNVYDGANFQKLFIKDGLISNIIWSIYFDREDNLWIGTDQGIDRLADDVFKGYEKFNNHLIEAWSITKDSKGNFWFGLDNKGVLLFDGKKFFQDKRFDKIKNYSVWSIFEDKKENMWLGIDSGLVYADKYNVIVYNKENGFCNDGVMAIFEDSKGNLWLGTFSSGIYKYDGKTFIKYDESNGLPSNWIYSILEDSKGNLWVGTYEGAGLFTGEKFIVPKGLEDLLKFGVMKIIEDSKGSLWFATYESGLFRYMYTNKGDGSIIDTVSARDGLNDNSILSMTMDLNGNLFIGTNIGINKFDLNKYYKNGTKEIIAYNKNDGLPGQECNQNAAFTESNGNIWFGTIKGLLTFNPKMVKSNLTKPLIHITNFKVFFEDINSLPGIKPQKDQSTFPERIVLNYDQNYITIEYTGICSSNSSDVHYKYQLSGSEWSPITKENSVTFPNLPPGEYTFRVMAQNNDGVWSADYAELKFAITPPLWKEPWVIILSAFLIAVLIYSWYKLRIKTIQAQKQNLEKIIEERYEYEKQLKISEGELIKAKEIAEKSDRLKSEFLAQMSHEIRTPINTMMSFSALIEDNVKDKIDEDLKDSFQIIRNGGRRLTNTIDSILNMSQIQIGTFETKPEELNLFSILNDLYIEFKPNAETKNLLLYLHNECTNDLFIADRYTVTQIFANLIDNAIKYTKTGQIAIRLYRNCDETICVDVKDTGIGISPEFQENLFNPFSQEETGYTRRYEGNGLGLALVKNYCELNGAEISISSVKGEGSIFTVEFRTQK